MQEVLIKQRQGQVAQDHRVEKSERWRVEIEAATVMEEEASEGDSNAKNDLEMTCPTYAWSCKWPRTQLSQSSYVQCI